MIRQTTRIDSDMARSKRPTAHSSQFKGSKRNLPLE
jgi:hypothetical protein